MNMLQNQIQTYEKELQDTVGKMKLAQIDSEIIKSNQEIQTFMKQQDKLQQNNQSME